MINNPETGVISPRLVGREPEMNILALALQTTRQGQGRCIFVAGEAGVGKSRLLAEIRRRAEAENFLVLQGHCFEPDLAFPYAPLVDALRSFFAPRSPIDIAQLLGPLAPEIVKLLPELHSILPEPIIPTSPLEPEAEKRRLFECLAQFLTGLIKADSHPSLVVIIEDVHWGDEASLDFLHFFSRRLSTFPVLLLASYRHDEAADNLSQTLSLLNRQRLAQEITLKRLQRDETDALLQAIFNLNRPVRTDFLDTIFNLTDGNPFFIEEVLKSLIAAGDIYYTLQGWDRKPLSDLHIPNSVQEAVRQRLAQLSNPAMQVLVLAAVAGRRFDFSLLHALTDYNETGLLALIKELVAAQLVIEESADKFVFRHALTRQAIYAGLLARERRRLHQAIAEKLEQLHENEPEVEAHLSYHYYQAQFWEKALVFGQRAGERAQQLYSLSAAVEHFSRAIEAARQAKLSPRVDLYRARSKAYQTIGVFEPAYNDLEAALKAAQADADGGVEWQILLDMGMLWVSRDYHQAGGYFRRALELTRSMDDQATVAHSLNRLGNYLANLEMPWEALPHHQQALAIFKQLQDRSGLAETLDLLGTTLVVGGDWVQGAAHYQQAAALFRQLDNRQGLASCLTMLTFRGGAYLNDTHVMPASFSEAVKDGEAALEIARQTGQRAAESVAACALAFSLGLQGHYARALKLAQTGQTIAKEIEHRHWLAFGYLALGALYVDLLAANQARENLEAALALAGEIGSKFFQNLAGGFLVSACILDGDLTRADAVNKISGPDMAELEARSPSNSRGQVWRGQIELALAQQDFELALQILDRLITLAPNMSEGVVIPRLWYLRGKALAGLGRWAEAESSLQASLEGATSQGFTSLCWRIQADLTQLYLNRRRRTQAEVVRSEAQAIITHLADGLPDGSLRQTFLARANEMLPELPPLTSRRAAKRAYDGLTRREREVAALVARGKSNREIAEALIVSERTAATHVGNILNKLGYNSRTQIAAWAVEKGLIK